MGAAAPTEGDYGNGMRLGVNSMLDDISRGHFEHILNMNQKCDGIVRHLEKDEIS